MNDLLVPNEEGKSSDEIKKITTLYIRKIILAFCKENKINLSEWLNTEFTDKFLSLNSYYHRLEELEKENQEINKKIEEIKQRCDIIKTNLTDREIQFIRSVKPRLIKGANLPSINNLFNNEFKRKFTLDEFRAIYQLYESNESKRVEYALSKHKK